MLMLTSCWFWWLERINSSVYCTKMFFNHNHEQLPFTNLLQLRTKQQQKQFSWLIKMQSNKLLWRRIIRLCALPPYKSKLSAFHSSPLCNNSRFGFSRAYVLMMKQASSYEKCKREIRSAAKWMITIILLCVILFINLSSVISDIWSLKPSFASLPSQRDNKVRLTKWSGCFVN